MTLADLLLVTLGLSGYLAVSSGVTFAALRRSDRLYLWLSAWSAASFVYQLARWRQVTATDTSRLYGADWWCLAMGIVLVALMVHVVRDLTGERRFTWVPRAFLGLVVVVLGLHATTELFITHGVSTYVDFSGRSVPFSTVGPLYLPVMLFSSLAAFAYGIPAIWGTKALSATEKWVWLAAGVAYQGLGGNDLLMFSGVTTGVLPGLPGQSLFEFGVVGFAVVMALRMAWRTQTMTDQLREASTSLTQANLGLEVAVVEARQAAKVKGEFLANVSHELRTPLNAIINIPEGLLEDFAAGPDGAVTYTGSPAETARYLRSLHTSGKHLLGVVNQVLDFSKLDAGRLTLQRGPVAVREVLETTQRTLASMAETRRIVLKTSGALGASLDADAVKLAQVLLNLGSNAVKHSPDGGTVEFSVHETEAAVEFRVRDEGVGIAPEHQHLIFEGFRQVESGATRKFGGTGLGLAISRRLAELHGGSLRVESVAGQGSTFIATLPRAPVTP